MRKVFLVIACYKDNKQHLYDTYIEPKNKAYCLKHGFEYVCVKEPPPLFRGNPTWWKFTIVRDMIKGGELKEGDHVTHLDADMVIVKDYMPYLSSKSFTYAIDNGNTHCMGNYSLRVDDWGVRLVDEILSEKRFEEAKKHSSFVDNFREQAIWYQIAGLPEHSWKSYFSLDNYGYLSNITYDPYSLTWLLRNVEVRGPEWNTTLLREEQGDDVSRMLQKYNIVSSKKENTIIRHFAGGQPWSMEYLK